MKRLFLVLAFVTGAFVLGGSGAYAQGTHMFAVLVGGNETPAAGDPDGFGSASVTFRGEDLTQVCVAIFVTGIGPATMAHIHRGFGDVAGPIVVTLTTPGANGFGVGCRTVSPELSRQIRANRYGFYINVHTAAFPGGAVRGQLF